MAPPSVPALVDARGQSTVERRGLPRRLGTLSADAYHLLRTATWTRIGLLFGALFLVVNVLFALILYLGRADIMNGHGFLDDFWFSVQTLGTIGYGNLAPNDLLSNTIVTIESFFGIALTAMMTGVFFSRFATPYAKVMFSKVAIIGEHDGRRTLMFRMANARSTAIVEATCHAYVLRDEILASGERMRRIYDLILRRSNSPIFSLSWLATHTIDATSPIADLTPETLTSGSVGLIITFQGIDDRLAATVHTRHTYNLEDIVFDRRFVDIIVMDEATGQRFLDFEKFHDTLPAVPAPPTRKAVPAEEATATSAPAPPNQLLGP